jgi:hypothetical protein
MTRIDSTGLVSVFCVILVTTPVKAQQDDTFRVYDVDSSTGYDLGRGYDILTNSPRNQCVIVSKTIEHPEYGPSEVNFKSYRIENSEQLDKALGISASASISAGVGSASASASYSSTLSVNSYSLTYVVQSSVRRKGKSIEAQDLQERYSRLLSSGNPSAYKRFRTICGDGYISEIPVGADFRAVIKIVTKSRAESESVSASLSGSYASMSGAASFSSAVKKVAQSNEVQIWNYRRGGEGAIPIGADDIATAAANLPVTSKDAPTPTQIVVISYVGLLSDPMLPLDNFSERSGQLDKLALLSSKAKDQLGDVDYIIKNPDQFFGQPADILQLSEEQNALYAFRQLVLARANECIEAAGACVVDDLTIPLPVARPARR